MIDIKKINIIKIIKTDRCFEMKTVNSVSEIKQNIETLDKYLETKKDPEYSFGLDLVKKGTCFIALREGNSYRFYPSRFIGYVNNNMDKHNNNEYKDGRETNREIEKMLGVRPLPNPSLDKSYREYCELLGFTANDKGTFGVERKYWELFL